MIDKILVGAAVWLAANPTGRKVAKGSYRVLAKLGDRAVKAMPASISSVFAGTENFVKNLTSDLSADSDDAEEKKE